MIPCDGVIAGHLHPTIGGPFPGIAKALERVDFCPALGAFVGTWKASTSSRGITSSTATYTFSQDAEGFIVIVRGGAQLRDRVRFDGKDYPTPDIPGRVVSWTKVSETVYETTIRRDGAVVAKGRWILADGGKRATQYTIPTRADGQDVTNATESVRTSGEGHSLLGEWKRMSFQAGEADLFVMTVSEGPTLKMFYPRNQDTHTIRLDGKEYVPTERSAWPDVTTSARSLGPRTLRRTTSRAGTPYLETLMAVSADGKTLTVSTRRPGSSDQPAVFVYERQE